MLVVDDVRGQYTIEFLIVVGVSLAIIIPLIISLADVNELNQAMTASRTGALEGALSDGLAIYPGDSFEHYETEHIRLLNPSSVKITKISYKNQGLSNAYNKTKIQLRIYASSPHIKDPKDRNCMGDRINYYARKKICESFQTENLTNSFYNPAFTDNYVFTTAEVRWE